MTTGSTGTKRRTLLQRGAALLAGGVALAGGAKLTGAAPAAATPPRTLTLYARPTLSGHGHGAGRLIASGELFDAPNGESVGSFHTNCFCATSPFGQPAESASNLEFHVLELKNGTLFGIGSGIETPAGRVLAIVGGTDAFAGRSGTYVQASIATGIGDDLRQVTITFAG